MPLDPSIISSYNPGPGIDVNALMQQRMQGMANINAMERQRQADALALEDRAAAQKAAQEDEIVKSLLPAYAHVFKTGDLDGGLSLAPPQYRANLVPYVDALRGKPLEEIQAALAGSLVTSDAGRAFLENYNRAQTLGVQQGQLDVSRQDIALRRQKQALDALGEGEWKLEPGEDGFFWTNPRTRQVIEAKITGAGPAPAVPGAAPAPDFGTPRIPAPGAPAVEAPISTQQPPKEFKPKAKAGEEKGTTEYQGKAMQHAVSMADANEIALELEDEGTVTSDAWTNAIIGIAQAFPTSFGDKLAAQLTNALNATMPSLSPEEQRLARAQLQFITAVLRSESGAEIKASEFPAEYQKYFALAGDEGNEKLLADKRRARRRRIATMREAAGKKGSEAIDRILTSEEVPPAPAEAPAPGATVDGFEYQGVEE